MYEKTPSQSQTLRAETVTPLHAHLKRSVEITHTDAVPRDDKATPQIECAVTRLSSLAHSLEAKVENLEARLHPVLRSIGPCTGEAKVGDELYRISDHLEKTLARLAELEARIEL